MGEIFNNNYQAYGTKRLQAELRKQGITVSRRRIGRIMAKMAGFRNTPVKNIVFKQKKAMNRWWGMNLIENLI